MAEAADTLLKSAAMEAKPASVFEQLSNAINAALPQGMTADVRDNLRAALKSACERLDLVTREELEVQEAVLARTRAKLDQLEIQIRELERTRNTG